MNISPSMTSNLSETKQVPVKPSLPHEKLRDALFYMQDILERCQMPFVVLGSIGKQIVEENDATLSANKVEFGIQKRHYTESGKSTFWSLMDQYHITATDEDEDIVLEYKDVPVYIKIIKNRYPFFDNPNDKFYFVENLNFPNPFEEYWDKRNEIE